MNNNGLKLIGNNRIKEIKKKRRSGKFEILLVGSCRCDFVIRWN